MGEQIHARITLIRRNGVVMGDSYEKESAVLTMENHLQRPEVQEALLKGVGASIRFSETVKMPMLYLAVPVKTEDQTIGFVRLAVPLTDLSRQTAQIKQLLFFTFLAAFALSIPIGFIFSKRLTNPLHQTLIAAKRFGQGDLSQRIQVRSNDEIENLGTIYNQMADELSLQLKEISEEKSQLSAILNGMMEGIIILNSKGKVLLVNPALERMFFLRSPLSKEIHYYELLRHHELNEFIRKTLLERQNFALDIAFATPRESYFQVQASVASGKNSGADVYIVLVFHEITDIKRLERIRKDFVANVSHELRTPLTSMKGYVEALQDLGQSLPEEGQKFLVILQKNTLRMENIVSDLLQLAKIESGKDRLNLKTIPLKSFLEKTILPLLPLTVGKNQTMEVQGEEDILLEADPEKLSQVVTNLIDNAIKYTPEGGKILAGCQKQDNQIELFVQDNGIGIPNNDLNRIFERFYRVDRARSREMGGTGLGLAIVKHIMEAHGGLIKVHSQPNAGSTFTAVFPLSSPQKNI